MAKEAILKIQETEIKASELIKNASDESKNIIKDAKLKGENEKKRIINEGKTMAENQLKNATKEAEKECNPIQEKNKLLVKEILNPATDKLNSVVDLVAERIVNFNGNS